jgi:HPt (histidine-containing phosphotransfer) domain-containing protein
MNHSTNNSPGANPAPTPAPDAACATPAARQPIRSLLAKHREIARILPEYLTDLPSQVFNLHTFLPEGKMAELRSQAHQLRGSGAGYGFPEITARAMAVEKAVDLNGTPEQLAVLVQSLIDLLRRLDGYDSAREAAA